MPVPAASSADGQNCRDEAAVEGGSADKAPCWEQSIEQLDPKTRGRRTQRCWSLVGGRYGVSVYKWAMGSGSWSSSQPFGLERAKMGASKVSRTASSLTRTEECSKACNGSIQATMQANADSEASVNQGDDRVPVSAGAKLERQRKEVNRMLLLMSCE
nr:uncharacterized protein LOC109767016 isoform X2 [Aegilops tauschii subsp. strangulata]